MAKIFCSVSGATGLHRPASFINFLHQLQSSTRSKNVRTHFLVGTILVLGSVLLAQSAPPSSAAQPQNADPATPGASPAASPQSDYEASIANEMKPSPSWKPGPDFLKNAHAACDSAQQPPSFAECFIDQMSKAGAPPEAVQFTRALYQHNGQVGIVGRTKVFGAIALAWIVYPLRANDNDGLMFLNSDPNYLDVDDLSKLDKAALPKDSVFQEWKKQYPQLDVWPGDRTGGSIQVLFARTYPSDNPSNQRFLFSYPLINGCHACERVGYANYWWDFSADGKFLGTKLISVSRVPPPLKRPHPRRPLTTSPGAPNSGAPSAAPQPQATPQPATSLQQQP
jgi:hypothetical protein